MTTFKEATEKENIFKTDFLLNHQFGAYLIRENTKLDIARYYLDLASIEYPSNPAIIHSIGNLHYALYKKYVEEHNNEKAIEHFDSAKVYFAKKRGLLMVPDEYGYVTDIMMTRLRVENTSITERSLRAELTAESEALFLEAMKVVPKENQNYLVKVVNQGKPFSKLDDIDKDFLKEKILSGTASAILLDYYSQDLLATPKSKSWRKLKNIVDIYKNKLDDISILTEVLYISKRAFIMTAENRFELLRVHYDRVIRYREEEISFITLSEYIKLLLVDAFVLGKFKFIRSAIGDIRSNIYIRSFPRFLKDEYILQKQFYSFDETDDENSIELFSSYTNEFDQKNYAQRFNRLVYLNPLDQEQFFNIEVDSDSKFHIRGVRKEVGTSQTKTYLEFNVKFAYDLFKATDFLT